MIASLDDAWAWYAHAREMIHTMRRLGSHHWDDLRRAVAADDRFRELESTAVVERSNVVLDDLDDFCIVLLFSVFESTVRAQVLDEVETELREWRHPALVRAVRALKENIDNGSFFNVLECYKGLDADLIEEVNQVRRYRNWVAHGRRGPQPDNVTPDQAHQRLLRFLTLLRHAPQREV